MEGSSLYEPGKPNDIDFHVGCCEITSMRWFETKDIRLDVKVSSISARDAAHSGCQPSQCKMMQNSMWRLHLEVLQLRPALRHDFGSCTHMMWTHGSRSFKKSQKVLWISYTMLLHCAMTDVKMSCHSLIHHCIVTTTIIFMIIIVINNINTDITPMFHRTIPSVKTMSLSCCYYATCWSIISMKCHKLRVLSSKTNRSTLFQYDV